MKPDHYSLPLGFRHELVVDNFAGGGGASTGIEMALGRNIDIAINHDPEAIAMHAINHPNTKHYCESVFKVDPVKITSNQPVGLLWASPDCTHFSRARGAAPKSPRVRGLMWVVIRWARRVKPRLIMMENVVEMKTACRLLPSGEPDVRYSGEHWELWCKQLKAAGYKFEHRELRACDYGAPTTRKRLFVIARRDGQPIVWPKPTHGPKGSGLLPFRTAAECIDWDLPCPSIFDRERPLADNTQRRIARGTMRYVINSADPFIVPQQAAAGPFVAGVGGRQGQSVERSVDRPCQTITSKADSAVVVPVITRIGQTGGGGTYSYEVTDPLTTVTTKAEHLLVSSTLTPASPTNLVAATMIQRGYGERPGQAPRVLDIQAPLGTVVAQGEKHGLVSAFLAKHYGGNETPGTALSRPVDTITSTDHHAFVAAHIVKGRTDAAGSAANEPLHTITAGGHQETRPGTGNGMALSVAHITKLRGTSTAQGADEPLHTMSAGGTHFAEVRALLIKFYGTEQDPKLREPLHTVTTHDRFGLVQVAGEDYRIVDIGMRMLTPRELFRAQGFPEFYRIDYSQVFVDQFRRPGDRTTESKKRRAHMIAKHAQVRMCGNSVCPPLAKALVEANFVHERAWMGEPQRQAA